MEHCGLHWDHPRVCGEKFTRKSAINCGSGSPPRVRGKGGCCSVRSVRNGITPACAGKSFFTLFITFLVQDHPRVCGEKARTLIAWEEPQGSPPRVRGKESNAKTGQKARRITPACAGKRATPSKNPHPGGDHPRVCGEKYTCAAVRACRLGSPPRVRGKVARRGLAFSGFGITPACAGKRASSFHSMLTRWDHPRVCGEKQLGKNATDYTLGSPPRVRGKVSVDEVNVFHGGITPACAGKRSSLFFTPLCCRDHPRVCGEKLTDYQLFWQKGGSPPRVRGKELLAIAYN